MARVFYCNIIMSIIVTVMVIIHVVIFYLEEPNVVFFCHTVLFRHPYKFILPNKRDGSQGHTVPGSDRVSGIHH